MMLRHVAPKGHRPLLRQRHMIAAILFMLRCHYAIDAYIYFLRLIMTSLVLRYNSAAEL